MFNTRVIHDNRYINIKDVYIQISLQFFIFYVHTINMYTSWTVSDLHKPQKMSQGDTSFWPKWSFGQNRALGLARFQLGSTQKCPPFAQDTAVQSPVDTAALSAWNVAGRSDAATHLLRISGRISNVFNMGPFRVVMSSEYSHVAVSCNEVYHGTRQVLGLEGRYPHGLP